MIRSPSSMFWRKFLDSNCRGWRPYGLLVGLCLVLYLPGITKLPVIDRDEPMYAQSSKQMVEDDQYVRIRFGAEDRNKKPIGIYWLQSLAAKATGIISQIWPYRLPSLLGVIIAALATFWAGKELFRPQAALVAALLLPCSLLLVFVGHLAITDAALLACVTLSQAALAAIYIRNIRIIDHSSTLISIVFWVALGCGILLKGPVVLIAPIGTTLAIRWREGDFQNLRGIGLWWGIPLLIAIVAPWLAAIQKATDGQFLRDSLGGDFFGKLVSVHEGHSAFPGFYLLGLPVSFWPGIIFLPSALLLAWRKRSRQTTLLIGWIVPLWIVLELIPTKLPHYIIPIFPALALLCGEYCTSADKRPDKRWSKWICLIISTITIFTPLAALSGFEIFLWYTRQESLYMPVIYLLMPALVFTVFALWKMRQSRRLELAASAIIFCAIISPIIFHYVLPAQKQFWITQQAGEKYKKLVSEHSYGMQPRMVSLGLHLPSLLFYCGRDTLLTSDPKEAANLLTTNPAAIALIDSNYVERFYQEMNARQISIEPAGNIRGFNYDKGEFCELEFYRLASGDDTE